MVIEFAIPGKSRKKGWNYPLDNPNETKIKRYKDCAFTAERETDHED